MYTHSRSVAHRVFDVWRSPDRFTKNPDMVRLPEGRLLLVYSDNDAHWSQESQVLTILASDDDGRTWFKLAEPGMADLRRGDERLVTPRLSLLKDGRLVVVVDHDDHGHFHTAQRPRQLGLLEQRQRQDLVGAPGHRHHRLRAGSRDGAAGRQPGRRRARDDS
jgi:hypothetical protein